MDFLRGVCVCVCVISIVNLQQNSGIQVSQTYLCHMKIRVSNKRSKLLPLAVTHLRFKVLAAVFRQLGLARCS